MSDQILAAMSRRARAAVSRRASLLALGTTAAIAAHPAFTTIGNASKKTRKLRNKKCQKQVNQCIAAIEELCQDDPVCESALTCCGLFANCNAAAALPCIFIN